MLFGLENGRPLTVPGAVDDLVKMGVRYVTLTHWSSHEWCDASTDEPRHGGLSPEGERIVWKLGKLGILPDVSHVSDDAVRHTLEAASGPVIASHSSARALCDHPRNLPDDLIREIARSGGLVMANSYPAFGAPSLPRRRPPRRRDQGGDAGDGGGVLPRPAQALEGEAPPGRRPPLPPVPLSLFVDHIVHLIEKAGEEHVGIGTDFDGIPDVLEGLEDISKFPALTTALLDHGVDKAGVKLILGGNFLRVLAEAERVAG